MNKRVVAIEDGHIVRDKEGDMDSITKKNTTITMRGR